MQPLEPGTSSWYTKGTVSVRAIENKTAIGQSVKPLTLVKKYLNAIIFLMKRRKNIYGFSTNLNTTR